MRAAVALSLALGCSAPASKPATTASTRPRAPAKRVTQELVFDPEQCGSEADPQVINAAESVTVITCYQPTDSDEREAIAYFVRRSAPTHGSRIELGSWTVRSEQGEYFEIAGVVRAAGGDATHVFVRHAKGGLDQMPDSELLVYVPDRDAFDPRTFNALDVRLEIAANGRSARVVTCDLQQGGTFYPDKDCSEHANAIVRTYTVP